MSHDTEIVEHKHHLKTQTIASLIRHHTGNDGEAGHSVLHFRDRQFLMPIEGSGNPDLLSALERIRTELARGKRDFALSMVPSQSLHGDTSLDMYERVEIPDFESIFTRIIASLEQSLDLKGNYALSISMRYQQSLSLHGRSLDVPERNQLDFYVCPSAFTINLADVLDVAQVEMLNRWYAGMFSGEISTSAIF